MKRTVICSLLLLVFSTFIYADGKPAIESFESYNGFFVDVYKWIDKGNDIRQFKGKVRFPENSHFRIARIGTDDTVFYLDKDNFVYSDEIDKTLLFRLNGFELIAKKIKLEKGGLSVIESAFVDRRGKTLGLPRFTLYIDGEIKESGDIEENEVYVYEGWKFSINSITVTNKGFELGTFITLPAGFDNEAVYFDDMELFMINGHLNTGTLRNGISLRINTEEYSLQIDEMYWDNGSFIIYELGVGRKDDGSYDNPVSYEMISLFPDGTMKKGSKAIDLLSAHE